MTWSKKTLGIVTPPLSFVLSMQITREREREVVNME
jgi:hypothetical protein